MNENTVNDAPGRAYPSFARARFAQAIVSLIGVFAAMDITVVSLLIEPMKRDLGITDLQVGLIQTTSFYGAYGLCAIPLGMLADRSSRVRMLLFAMIVWCGSLTLVGLSHGLWLLALAKAGMGIAVAVTYPAAMSLMSDNFAPSRRAFATATFGMGQDLGGGAGFLVGGLGYAALVARVAADPHALGGVSPWRAVSLLFALCGVLIIPAVLMIQEPQRMERSSVGPGSPQELWQYRRFLLPLFGGMMALGCVVSGLRTWLAPALMRLHGLEPGDFVVWLSLVMLLGGFVGHALSSKLVNVALVHGGHRTAMTMAAIASALCFPCSFLATASQIWAFAVLLGLFMVASGVAVSIPVIVINFQIPNELRGLCMGVYIVLLSLAGMFGAPLIGYTSQVLGGNMMLGEAMALVSAPSALLAAFCFWMAKRAAPNPCPQPRATIT